MEPGETCRNCQTPLSGPFCFDCGQKHTRDERALWDVLADWLRETFEADGRLFRTLTPFFLRPGRLVEDYLAGRRARYMSPVRLYIFSLLIAFFTLGVLADPDRWGDDAELQFVADEASGEAERPSDVERGASDDDPGLMDRLEQRVAEQGRKLQALPPAQALRLLFSAFLDSAPTILTLLVPVFAVLLKLLYWRRYYVDHLLFSLVLHALALLLATIAGAVGALVSSGLVALASFAVLVVHLVVGLQRVYGGRRRVTALKSAALAVVYSIALLAGAVISGVVAVLRT